MAVWLETALRPAVELMRIEAKGGSATSSYAIEGRLNKRHAIRLKAESVVRRKKKSFAVVILVGILPSVD